VHQIQPGEQQIHGEQSHHDQDSQPLAAMLPPDKPHHWTTPMLSRSPVADTACGCGCGSFCCGRYASTISSSETSCTSQHEPKTAPFVRTSSVVCRPAWLASMTLCTLAMAASS